MVIARYILTKSTERNMKLTIDESVLEMFPSLTIGLIKGSINRPKPDLSEKIAQLRQDALDRVGDSGLETAKLMELVNISAWRKAYQAFGVKPKTHKPTHEALIRRLLKDRDWPPNINPIVDIYLSNQAIHLLPHGGYDFDELSGEIHLEVSPGDEVFEPLGGGEERVDVGEVIYRDEARVLTRRWNYRDCDATKITESTSNFILMIEAPSDEIEQNAVEDASCDLVGRLQQCFDGEFSWKVTRPAVDNRSCEI